MSEEHLLLVHRADQLLLGPVDRVVAEAAGAKDWIRGERVILRPHLVASDGARVSVGSGIGEAHLPVRGVRAEEEHVRPGIARALDRVALLSVPVLVVADAQEGAMTPQPGCSFPRYVEIRRVADVISGALEEARHVRFAAQHEAGAVIGDVRPVETDLDGELAREAELVVVERLTHPAVVGLVRRHAGLEVQIAHAIVLHDERHVGAVGERLVAQDANEVQAAHGGLRDLHGKGGRPVALDESGRRIRWTRGLRASAGVPLDQLARPGAPVPAEAV